MNTIVRFAHNSFEIRAASLSFPSWVARERHGAHRRGLGRSVSVHRPGGGFPAHVTIKITEVLCSVNSKKVAFRTGRSGAACRALLPTAPEPPGSGGELRDLAIDYIPRSSSPSRAKSETKLRGASDVL